jgi:hypothetical protein
MKLLIALFFLAVIGVLFFEALRLMSEEDVPSGPSLEMLVPGR